MSHGTPLQNLSEGALQRGKACLSCRRRKMRCDGQRPFCSQCLRGNRTEDCEYTDNQGRTRTQMLEEHVALLQARIHELENPRVSTQSVQLHDPYRSSHYTDTAATASSSSVLSDSSVMAWWELEEPPAQITEMLVGTFLPHAASLGFALSTRHFLSDMRLPTGHPERPHAALLHAVILWALRLSGSMDFMQHENLYLQRSILALQGALGRDAGIGGWILARQRIHAIQAEILLAQYLLMAGRLLEGRYHANAAVSLAVSCGLHRIEPPSDLPLLGTEANPSPGTLELSPPTNPMCYGERLRTFWSVFVLDRCWSAALGAPCLLSDDSALGTQIDSGWPMDAVDYERIQSNVTAFPVINGNGRTIQRFLAGESPMRRNDGSLSHATLRVMASVVFERTARLSRLWHSQSTQGPSLSSIRTEMQVLARITTQFAGALIPVQQLLAERHEGRETLLFIHSLAHAAMMTMHSVRALDLAPDNLNAINSALTHASEIVKIVEALSGDDSAFIDPVLGIIGYSAGQTFLQEERRVRSVQDSQGTTSQTSDRLASLRASITRLAHSLERCAGPSGSNTIFSQQADEILEAADDE